VTYDKSKMTRQLQSPSVPDFPSSRWNPPKFHSFPSALSDLNFCFQIGRLLPLISRAVVSACMPDIPHADADYNVVQNNGHGAAQVIPHAHFHVIPRYPFDYTPPNSKLQQEAETRKGGWKRKVPEGIAATKILFGRGMRHYRDDEDAEELVRVMRERVKVEWEREFGREELEGGGGRGKL
jgi:diadenosine tetraphosphate (Ap4A) HIT family hydrolase